MCNVRPGTNVMAKVGDCSKLKLTEIDLISRTLKCEKEIFHFDDKLSFTSQQDQDGAEEEIPLQTTEDASDNDDRFGQTVEDLDCLIRRIEQMQLIVENHRAQKILLRKTAIAERDKAIAAKRREQENLEISPMNCEEIFQIANLEHAHHKLQGQLDEMTSTYRRLRTMMKKTLNSMCHLEKEMHRIKNIGQEYKQWAEGTASEVNVCSDRHQYLVNKMISKKEAKLVVKGHTAAAFKRSVKCLKRRAIAGQLLKFHQKIGELVQYAQDLRTEMDKRFSNLDQLAKIQINQLANNPGSEESIN